jgi:hypothetical protein
MSQPADQLNPAPVIPQPAAPPRPRRTAVLVIHGVGSQRPLQTLRAAADALYAHDPACMARHGGKPAPLWLTFDPDNDERDLDLPKLTTADLAAPGETPLLADFHECYWADLMSETRFVAVPLWLFELVRKGPNGMAARIRPLWYVVLLLLDLWLLASAFPILWAAAALTGWMPAPSIGAGCVWAAAAAAAWLAMGRNGVLALCGLALTATLLASVVHDRWGVPLALGSHHAMWFSLVMIGVLVVMNMLVLQTVVGDAARYYRAAPANIGVRRAIRSLAVDRLEALHKDAKYDRIVVVAHSLGSVIGYDMLHAYWAQICNRLGDPSHDADFLAQDRMSGQPAAQFDARLWRRRTRTLFDKLQTLDEPKGKKAWKVSDFITLGSPLTHAAYLSADGTSSAELAASFHRKRLERELPQNPAWHIPGQDGALIFRLPSQQRSFLHAGAMFGVTRWTNLRFPLSGVIFGDVVGGEVVSAFGRGVDDKQVKFGAFPHWLAHTHYFNIADPAAEHLTLLRKAVNLRREPVAD